MSYNSSQNSDVTKTKIDDIMNLNKFRVKVNNRMKGSYAETDFDKRTVTINKKRHRTKPLHKKRYAEIADTIRHEKFHIEHPKMTEKVVRKRTGKWIKKASKKQKQKLYSTTTIYKNNSTQYK